RAGLGQERHVVADVEVAPGAHPDAIHLEVAHLGPSIPHYGQGPEPIPHVERVEQRENLGVCHGSGSREEARRVPERLPRETGESPSGERSDLRVFPMLGYIALPSWNKSACYVGAKTPRTAGGPRQARSSRRGPSPGRRSGAAARPRSR